MAARVVRVNDRSVTVGGLAALGERLAEIHGQHEQQRLLAADRQLALLDRFGELAERVAEVAAVHRAWRATVAQAAELLTDEHELARRVELLRHQVDEITAAGLQAGEDEELERTAAGCRQRGGDRARRPTRGPGSARRVGRAGRAGRGAGRAGAGGRAMTNASPAAGRAGRRSRRRRWSWPVTPPRSASGSTWIRRAAPPPRSGWRCSTT